MKENLIDDNKVKNKIHTSYTILVVEDDEGLSHLIQRNLKRASFQTAGASNGAEAIAWIIDNPATLLLLDYRLPDMSGKELIETLADHYRSVPFITMTGHGDEKLAVEMMKLGARDYLVKDAEFLDLLPSLASRVVEQLEIERKLHEAEEALKRSEERYHTLFEFANVGIIVVENSTITQFNKKAEEIYGFSKEELIGQSPDIVTPERYRKQHSELLNEIAKFGKAKKTVFEEEGIRKDGSFFPIEISFALTLKEGYMIIAVIRDITERKEMEHKLLQSKKLKSLGELAGGVAHDFNNVLAAILGRVQLARMIMKAPQGERERRKSVVELKKSLEVIEKAALDGAETVRKIQEFSRRKDDDKYFTKVDLNKVIDDALEFTRVRWKDEAEAKGIKIRIKKEFSPLFPITGSTSDLREVFTNIINNAIDAMSQGGNITIQTFKENSHLITQIKDTGIGIPKAIRDMIFDPFFTTKGIQSTGLGLSVSYGIIKRHGGIITVDSVEGQGSTFNIKLPLSENSIEVQLEDSKLRKSSVDLVVNKPFKVEQVLRMVQEGMELKGMAKKKATKTISNARKKSPKPRMRNKSRKQ